MAIFSKITLQRLITELSSHIKKEQLVNFAYVLNKASEKSISDEWELILLYVFSKLGKIEHERDSGSSKPDIWLTLEKSNFYDLVSDVTAVSDSGRFLESISQIFRKKLREEVNKRGLKLEQFSWEFRFIRDDWTVDDFLNDELKQFLDDISQNKKSPASYKNESKQFKVDFKPNFGTTTRTSLITTHKKLDNNPFFNALSSKQKQLNPIVDIPKGIILCDGGSEMFHFNKQTTPINWGSDDIIKYFLKSNQDISFVLSVWIERKPSFVGQERYYKVRTQLFENRDFNNLDSRIQDFLRNIEKEFPTALMTVDAALDCIRDSTISNYAGAFKLDVS